jgi:hypothetical protein
MGTHLMPKLFNEKPDLFHTVPLNVMVPGCILKQTSVEALWLHDYDRQA